MQKNLNFINSKFFSTHLFNILSVKMGNMYEVYCYIQKYDLCLKKKHLGN